ncbi:MAG: aminotransferase class V-fold PLP-dependent enzyme [Pseudomonadota bacterium]
MDLNRGRSLTSIPGPSVIPEQVLSSMHRSFPNMYEGDLVDMSLGILDELPVLAGTSGRAFMAISNGHGAWEMSLTNTLCRGDKVLVLATGRFAIGWGDQAAALGCEVETMDFGDQAPVDPDAVAERLSADTGHEIKAVLVVQIDTASSVWNDIEAIGKAIRSTGHPALYMVDCVASLGCVPYQMDAWGVDLTMGGSQKGLMVPPGLGLVWAGERALAAHQRADMKTPYWSWTPRMQEGAHYLKYCGTPPIQHIYAMRTALDMLADEGMENVFARHKVFADAVRAAVAAWSHPDGLSFNIADPAHRANSTTTILSGSIESEKMRQITESQAGLTLGVGLGGFDGRAFRIGHMGHLNPPMVLGTLATTEAALIALDAPLGGSGAAAAARVIADAFDAGNAPQNAPVSRRPEDVTVPA